MLKDELRLTLMIIFVALSGCASSPAPKPTCAEPAPTADQINLAVKTFVETTNWKDPSSVQIRNVHLMCRAHWRGAGVLAHGRTDGYEVDIEVNARNSYGGLTGFEPKSITLAGVDVTP